MIKYWMLYKTILISPTSRLIMLDIQENEKLSLDMSR